MQCSESGINGVHGDIGGAPCFRARPRIIPGVPDRESSAEVASLLAYRLDGRGANLGSLSLSIIHGGSSQRLR